MDETNVTVAILRDIRDEIRGTNTRVDSLREEMDQRLSQTNERLDFIADGQIRLRTEVTELRVVTEQLRGVAERNGERFEHFLATEGDVIRDLKGRMTRVEVHLGLDSASP